MGAVETRSGAFPSGKRSPGSGGRRGRQLANYPNLPRLPNPPPPHHATGIHKNQFTYHLSLEIAKRKAAKNPPVEEAPVKALPDAALQAEIAAIKADDARKAKFYNRKKLL